MEVKGNREIEKLYTFVEDKNIKLQGVVYNEKLLGKFEKFFGENYFRHAVQTMEGGPVTVAVKKPNCTIFHVNFSAEFCIKLITSTVDEKMPWTILTENFRTIRPDRIGQDLFLKISHEPTKIKNGDVLVNWKNQLFYVHEEKYFKCHRVEGGTVLKENEINRETLVEITGIKTEF